ncbi:mitochondrial 18 KDa protein-domain-containing protein [Chaetomium sp. MPI-SDFR-AT-0129]|nr:mitochondrial 18 KDa protein-domain-containing protein [Chaetomium sp. MPI-SDFR-AT-0129]
MWPFGGSPDKPTGTPTTSQPQAGQNAPNGSKSAASGVDPKALPDREKLPPKLQKIMDKTDKDENFFDELVEGYAPPSTDSNLRYAAYAARARTILLSAHRYVAYTSDIGESFRPVAHPWLVRGAYGVSWAYILGDVSYEGYKAYLHNQRVLDPQLELTARQQQILGVSDVGGEIKKPTAPGTVTPLEDYRTVMLQRGIFQSVASMGLPAFTIHSVVRYSGRAMKDVKNAKVRTWGPIGLGLAVVPFLPALFDKPVENAVEWVFHKGFATYGGPEAVGSTTQIGRERQLSERPKTKTE